MPERTFQGRAASKVLEERAMEEAVRPQALPREQTLGHAADAELVAACAEGVPGAFRELLARYRRSALTLAYQMLGDPEEAEDIAQEAFVRVFQAVPRFRGEAAFSTWLYRIVTNLCLGRMRRARPTVALDQAREPSALESPCRRVTAAMVTRQVLAEMPAELRAILLLREQEGLTYRDISSALGIPVGTVRSRLSKARALFRALWSGLTQEEHGGC